MAKKKIGIYGVQESTANNKIEDLYIIVDEQSICFVVKNHTNNDHVAFEYFENNPDQQGWNQLLGYLQNNSKLIQLFYRQVQFVMNSKRTLLTKVVNTNADSFYQNEFRLILGHKIDEELQVQTIANDQALIYGVPDALSTLLTRSFPTGKWTSFVGSLIASIQEDGIYLTLFDAYFIVTCVVNGKTHFVNYFTKRGDDHNQYLLLNVCVQTDINPNLSNLYIRGFSPTRDLWIQALSSYFANVHIEVAPETGVGNTLNKEYPNHSYAPYFIF